MLKTRVLSAIIGFPIIIFFITMRGSYLFFFTLFLALVGFREYKQSFKNVNIKVFEYAGYFVTLLYFAALAYNLEMRYLGFIIAFYVIFMLAYEVMFNKNNIVGIAISLFGFFYITFLFSHLIFIDRLPQAEILLWLPVLTASGTDTTSYFVGVNLGKHKLCPKVSPKKTVEGAIGGIAGSILIALLFGVIINNIGYVIPLYHFVVIGLLCGITSQLGDLSASYIKRFCGVKDYGKLIPGHGGILDRFDSILFTAPTIYYYFAVVLKIVN